MGICKKCPMFSENRKLEGWNTLRMDEHCTDCGCTLSAKARCLSCKCPMDRWLSVLNEEEHEEVKTIINGK
jgi:hypothetical protein